MKTSLSCKRLDCIYNKGFAGCSIIPSKDMNGNCMSVQYKSEQNIRESFTHEREAPKTPAPTSRGDNGVDQIITNIKNELTLAKIKHPEFPTDVIHQVAVMAEESGESIKASYELIYEDGNLNDLKTELLQTAAMCIRVLENLPE